MRRKIKQITLENKIYLASSNKDRLIRKQELANIKGHTDEAKLLQEEIAKEQSNIDGFLDQLIKLLADS